MAEVDVRRFSCFRRQIVALGAMAAVLAMAAMAPPVKPEVLFERWYIVQLQDQDAGWMHVKESKGDGQLKHESEIRIRLGRGGTPIKIQLVGRFVETEGFVPVEMWSLQDLAVAAGSRTTFRFRDDHLEVERGTGDGNVTKETMPLPKGEWMTPGAAAKYTTDQLAAGAREIVVRTIDPQSGIEPMTITRKIKKEDVPITAMGKEWKAIQWETISDQAPSIVMTEFVDNEGNLIKGTVPYGALRMTMIAATKSAALATTRAGAGADVPEIMTDTFARPDKPIRRARETTKLVMELSVTEGAIDDLPTTASQTVERVGENLLRATVTTALPTPKAPEEEAADPAYLKSTTFITSDDARVRELTAKATKGMGPDPGERAEAMRALVNDYISAKQLGVGFATAAETAKTATGDCSEHGVLLAAMLRADGIPARVASGLVYAEHFAGESGIFGYHMWAQALIDGRWVDYDATLNQRFDATHITVATSALADDGGLMTDMSAIAPLIGRLKVKVVEQENGK